VFISRMSPPSLSRQNSRVDHWIEANLHLEGFSKAVDGDLRDHARGLKLRSDKIGIRNQARDECSRTRILKQDSPDDIQIRGNRTTLPRQRELYPFRRHPTV
jgi:hypothetical protein